MEGEIARADRLETAEAPGVRRAPRRIVVRPELCSGCRACEVACVATHEGRFGTARARIRVTKMEHLGVDHPQVCHLCLRAPCRAACPTGALTRSETTAAILVDLERCIGCYACMDACPFGVVIRDPVSGGVLICDLCAGDPACVQRCAPGAIAYTTAESLPRRRREQLALQMAGEAQEGDL